MSVGETRYYRVYLRNDLYQSGVSVGSSNHHPLETAYDGASTGGFAWKFATNGDGTFPLYFVIAYSTNPYPLYTWAKGNPTEKLLIGETYRLEWSVLKTATNTITLDMRLYNSSNTLIWDKSNIRAQGRDDNVGCNFCLLQDFGSNLNMDETKLTQIRFGTNGGGPWVFASTHYFYWGGVCVRNDTWCGAYLPGGP